MTLLFCLHPLFCADTRGGGGGYGGGERKERKPVGRACPSVTMTLLFVCTPSFVQIRVVAAVALVAVMVVANARSASLLAVHALLSQ
jgi:hypothetical protein